MKFLTTSFRWLVYVTMAYLPWSVLLSVWGTSQDFLALKYIKEILGFFLLIIVSLGIFLKKKFFPTLLEILTISFVLILLAVSWSNGTPIRGIIYGLRYDVFFLLIGILVIRGVEMYGIQLKKISRIFLLSGGIMLALSLCVRYVFGETILTLVGFGERVSVWSGVTPPIYHGIPGASVVRFQGLLEGPNQMAMFLLVYAGVYLTTFFRYQRYRFINVCLMLLFVFLLFQTYSRSALLGASIGGVYFILAGSCDLWQRSKKIRNTHKYTGKKILISLCLILGILGIGLWLFSDKFTEIIFRQGSTSAHMERMTLGWQRFRELPLGHGLASAGPASRALYDVNQIVIDNAGFDPEIQKLTNIFSAKNPLFEMTTEHYYIPESWYLQVLIEGGIFGGCVFVMICGVIFFSLKKYRYFQAMFLAICIMNIFLHAFESVHTAMAMMILMGIVPVSFKKSDLLET